MSGLQLGAVGVSGDIWQWLTYYLNYRTGKVDATGISWVDVRDVAKHLMIHGRPL